MTYFWIPTPSRTYFFIYFILNVLSYFVFIINIKQFICECTKDNMPNLFITSFSGKKKLKVVFGFWFN